MLINFTGILLNAGSDFRSPRDRDDLGNTDWGVVGGRRVRSPEVGADALVTTTSNLKVKCFLKHSEGWPRSREFENPGRQQRPLSSRIWN